MPASDVLALASEDSREADLRRRVREAEAAAERLNSERVRTPPGGCTLRV